MKWTLRAIRQRIPDWARRCVPLAVKRRVAERLRAREDAPIRGFDLWIPAELKRTARRRALVSYLTRPLRLSEDDPDRCKFSPFGLARSIVRALNEMGYESDVIDWRDPGFRPRRRYDLFVGHGGVATARLMKLLGAEIPKIMYCPGPYWKHFVRQQKARFDALERRRGVRLPYDPVTWPGDEEAIRNAHGVIVLGNERLAAEYAEFRDVIHLNNAAYPVKNDRTARREFGNAARNFLFFAGRGNVHKGLDLLLEVFPRTRAHLYICQDIAPAFREAYRRELEECPNIHVIGWVQMRSDRFHELVDRCAWIILPSCAEGQPGSVIECMHYGLIPIVSRECNISTDDFGITLKDCSLDEIEQTVRDLSQRPPEWCAEMARRTGRAATEKFSEEVFVKNFEESVQKILADTRPGKAHVGRAVKEG